jgi:hypothetical protein
LDFHCEALTMVSRLRGILNWQLVGTTVATMCAMFYGAAAAQSGGPYAIVASVINGGGGTEAAGGGLSLDMTIGEAQAGALAGGSYAMDTGFLSTALPEANSCVGDCNGDGQVTVDEVLTLVSVALATSQPAACSDAGLPIGGDVDIAVILQAVNNALNGCPATATRAT